MKSLVNQSVSLVVSTDSLFAEDVINSFITSRHLAVRSQKTYRSNVKKLFKYFIEQDITMPTRDDMDSFIESLISSGKATATVRLNLQICRLFFKYLFSHGIYQDICADIQLRRAKVICHKRKPLTNAQARKMLSAITGESLRARRDKTIVAISLACGLRQIEIERLNVGDYEHNDNGTANLWIQGKGRGADEKELVIVPSEVRSIVDSYLDLRGWRDIGAPLFISTSHNKSLHGERLSSQSVGKLLAKLIRQDLGIHDSRVVAHSTRHTAATIAIAAGQDIRQVQAMLRHRDLSTTVRYLHDMNAQNRQAEIAVAATLFGGAV